MDWRPLRARLTATQRESILTDPDHFIQLGADARPPAALGRRQRETIGGKVLGAVSDDPDLQATAQPSWLRPIGGAPIGPEGLPVEAAMLLPPTDERPPIIPHPLQQGLRRRPGIKEHVLRVTAQAVAGIAQSCQGQRVLGRTSLVPESSAQRNP
jgi:hypothetical protein